MNKKRSFTATFNGLNWGYFNFHIINGLGNGKAGYCNDFDFRRKKCAACFKENRWLALNINVVHDASAYALMELPAPLIARSMACFRLDLYKRSRPVKH